MPSDAIIANQQAAWQQHAKELMEARQKLHDESLQKLQQLMTQPDIPLKELGGMMLFGHRLINWAASRASEYADINAYMLGLLHEIQQEDAGRIFNYNGVLSEFEKTLLPWLLNQRKEEQAREELREKRLRAVCTQLKSKVVPLPLNFSKKFSEGMTHADILPVFGRDSTVYLLTNLCAKTYTAAGGKVALLAAEAEKHDRDVAQVIIPAAEWEGCGDTVGRLIQMLKAHTAIDAVQPIGMLVVDDIAPLITGNAVEHAMARLVRSFAVLQQLQAIYPMAVVVGIPAMRDQPAGMRPQEVYPPYLTERPHIWADIKGSALVKDSVNIVIDEDIYPLTQLIDMAGVPKIIKTGG